MVSSTTNTTTNATVNTVSTTSPSHAEVADYDYEVPLNFMDVNHSFAIAIIAALALAAVVGTFGNVLILVAVATQRQLRNVEAVFLINLACCDLYVTLFAEPLSIVAKTVGWRVFEGVPHLCRVIGYLCTLSCVGSLMTLSIMSLNRYVLICHHTLYAVIFTKRKCLLFCLFTYIFGFFLISFNFYGIGDHAFDYKSYECVWDRMASHDYTIVFAIVLVWVPIAITGLAYSRTYSYVREVRHNVTKGRSDKGGSKGGGGREGGMSSGGGGGEGRGKKTPFSDQKSVVLPVNAWHGNDKDRGMDSKGEGIGGGGVGSGGSGGGDGEGMEMINVAAWQENDTGREEEKTISTTALRKNYGTVNAEGQTEEHSDEKAQNGRSFTNGKKRSYALHTEGQTDGGMIRTEKNGRHLTTAGEALSDCLDIDEHTTDHAGRDMAVTSPMTGQQDVELGEKDLQDTQQMVTKCGGHTRASVTFFSTEDADGSNTSTEKPSVRNQSSSFTTTTDAATPTRVMIKTTTDTTSPKPTITYNIPTTNTTSATTTTTTSNNTNTSTTTNNTITNQHPGLKLARPLFIIYVVFSTCWIPYSLVIMADRENRLPHELHAFITAFAHLNSSINWLVYYHTHNKMRRAFRGLLGLRLHSSSSATVRPLTTAVTDYA